MGNKYAVRMFMFRCNLIVWQLVCQLLYETDNLLMPRHILHCQVAGFRITTVRDTLLNDNNIGPFN